MSYKLHEGVEAMFTKDLAGSEDLLIEAYDAMQSAMHLIDAGLAKAEAGDDAEGWDRIASAEHTLGLALHCLCDRSPAMRMAARARRPGLARGDA